MTAYLDRLHADIAGAKDALSQGPDRRVQVSGYSYRQDEWVKYANAQLQAAMSQHLVITPEQLAQYGEKIILLLGDDQWDHIAPKKDFIEYVSTHIAFYWGEHHWQSFLATWMNENLCSGAGVWSAVSAVGPWEKDETNQARVEILAAALSEGKHLMSGSDTELTEEVKNIVVHFLRKVRDYFASKKE